MGPPSELQALRWERKGEQVTDTKFDALEWLRGQAHLQLSIGDVGGRRLGAQFSAAADELEQARARIAELEAEIQSAHESALRVVIRRRIGYDKTPCSECSGLGIKMYGSTATWRGGIGGQMITDDVCDRCWGSGDADMPWPSWRKSDAELGDALKAARGDKLFQELEHRYMTVCADLDRLRSENETLQERLKTAREAADEIAWEVRGIPYVAGLGKLLDATELVSPETADRHTQESPAKPKESSDE